MALLCIFVSCSCSICIIGPQGSEAALGRIQRGLIFFKAETSEKTSEEQCLKQPLNCRICQRCWRLGSQWVIFFSRKNTFFGFLLLAFREISWFLRFSGGFNSAESGMRLSLLQMSASVSQGPDVMLAQWSLGQTGGADSCIQAAEKTPRNPKIHRKSSKRKINQCSNLLASKHQGW